VCHDTAHRLWQQQAEREHAMEQSGTRAASCGTQQREEESKNSLGLNDERIGAS
jgi:hypothetical protein